MSGIPRRAMLQGAAAATAAAAATTVGTTAAVAAGKGKGHGKGPSPKEPTTPTPVTGNVPDGLEKFYDPTYDVVRGQVPASYHPWVSTREDRILLYTRTAGPRHAHLGPALAAGLNPTLTSAHVLQNAIITWMAEVGVEVDWTEDVTQMAISASAPYKAVVFGSTSRDTMWRHGTAVDSSAAVNTTTGAHLDAAKTALHQYMRAGGGFVGIHNAVGGTEYNWKWFEGLTGSQYYDHGALQDGTVVTYAKDSSTEGLPARWAFKDEWYNWMPFPTRVKFLLGVDESTLATKSQVHPGHGKFHPLSWCQYYDGGRSFITALGHDSLAWTDGSDYPGQKFFKKHVVNGILSTMGKLPFCS
ncbi:MAG: ThuA domain-containing protein [Nocardioides sp.]|uniref:ThuA domain-containing protein n=1 Tax=Nocardioides sp. TaxID=35761 RepID=UPI0039E45921